MPSGRRFRKGVSGNPNGRPRKYLHKKDGQYFRLYGMTFDEYQRKLESQGGKCAICGTTNSGGRNFPNGSKAGFAVDHAHVEGYSKMPPEEKRKHVRGLLCVRCNNNIVSLLEDNIDLIRKAEEYLESYS